MYKFFQKCKCVNMVSQKMQISQIPLILSNEKRQTASSQLNCLLLKYNKINRIYDSYY